MSKHLGFKDRKLIEILYKKVPVTQIASTMGYSSTTIYRELKRCPKNAYSAEAAEDDAVKSRQNSVYSRRRSAMNAIQSKELMKELEDIFIGQEITNLSADSNLSPEKIMQYFSKNGKKEGRISYEEQI